MNARAAPFELPLPRRGVVAVLLTEREQTEVSELERHFRAADWPSGVETLLPDPATRDSLVDWFGIVQFPCVAIVVDGMLLGVEHECSEQACARLAEHAKSVGAPPFDV